MWKKYGKAVIACLLWSTAFVGVKTGLEYAPPLFFAGIRFMLAGVLALLLSRRYRALPAFLRESWRLILLVGFLQTGVMYALYFHGVNLLPAAIAAIILGAEPLITAVTTHFTIHDDRLTLRKTVSLMFAVVGVVLISLGRNSSNAREAELLGIVLLLVSAFANASSQVIVKKHPRDPLLLNATQLFWGGLLLLAASFSSESGITLRLPMVFYGALLWLSFISGFAFNIWYTLLRDPTIKVSEVNLFKFIVPVSGALLGWLIFPEDNPDIMSLSGMLVIAAAIVLFFYSRSLIEKIASAD
ncbi:MAG: DMT family transporter [Spirochaetota bacterium]